MGFALSAAMGAEVTERFSEWLIILGQRDWALTQFTGLAILAVLMWEGIRLWAAG